MVTKIKELPTNKTTTLTTIVKEIKEKPTSAKRKRNISNSCR